MSLWQGKVKHYGMVFRVRKHPIIQIQQQNSKIDVSIQLCWLDEAITKLWIRKVRTAQKQPIRQVITA